MVQKIIKIGTSAGIILSSSLLEGWGLKVGDIIDVEVNKENRTIIIYPVKKEVVKWTNSFIKRYRKGLEALAKK